MLKTFIPGLLLIFKESLRFIIIHNLIIFDRQCTEIINVSLGSTRHEVFHEKVELTLILEHCLKRKFLGTGEKDRDIDDFK